MAPELLRPLLASWPRPVQWGLLLALSAIGAVALETAHLPAAFLLGPMIAGILVETGGGQLRTPKVFNHFAQAAIGLMIARSITLPILGAFGHQWLLFLAVVGAILLFATALGYGLSRFRILPGTTAIWGILPGGASVMMLMAEGFGADFRLVAFMQYLRVVLVTVAASVVARIYVHALGPPPAVIWFPALHVAAFVLTLALLAAAVVLATRVWPRLPAGAFLIAMALGSGVNLGGAFALELPPWLLVTAYALMGWSIGLRFNRPILAAAARALPQTVLSILAMMAFCGAIAWVLVETLHIDPLTAYLATSPGGVDSVAIIAASSHVDTPFVMALQTVRFLVVMLLGAPLARFMAGVAQRAGIDEAVRPG